MQKPVEVLAVDASDAALAGLRATVAPLGVNLIEAPSGEEALRCLLHEPDLAAILMDVDLPGMSGLDTAAAIRSRHRTRYVPLIFVSDQDTQAVAIAAYASGAVDYLVKPYDPVVLRSKLAVFLDLHVLRRSVEGVSHRPLHDHLTGLPNRELFAERLEQALVRAHRRVAPLAVLFADLDGFQRVNDAHGHDTGDAVLAEAAHRLRQLVRTSDTVARHGGDEFTVLAEDVGDMESARELGERIAEELGRPYAQGLEVTASVGVAFTANPAGASMDGLIRRADHAMYRSKRPGAQRAEVSRVQPGLLESAPR